MKIAVLGAGAWGTAIAISLSARNHVTLWARNGVLCTAMRETRTNERYLPGAVLPVQLEITEHIHSALADAELALIAVTTAGLRETLEQVASTSSFPPLVWLCKGFEAAHARLPHQVYSGVMRDQRAFGVLSGPSFAQEVAVGLPTALTLASPSSHFAQATARALHIPSLRVYSSEDVIGVEVAGAVKNVIAIAAGISDGLRYGYNARAALITRGLAEIARLGVAMGGRADTFMGLAGAGDLILTCTGDLSRNRQVGLQLAQGLPLGTILESLGHVAEGVNSARAIARIADNLGIEMPITRAVCTVLDDHTRARAAADQLLSREPKAEY